LRGVLIGVVLLAAVMTAPSFAQNATAQATSAPSASATSTATPSPTPQWSLSGFDDVTYTTPTTANGTFLFTNGGSARVFDGITGNNTKTPQMTRFVPNNFNFNIRKNTTQGLGGQLEISLGSDANVIASYGGAAGTFTDVTQAFLYYATGPWTLNVGKFETLAGAEVIESPSDWEISRSILFGYAIPFTHTGGRLVYAPSTKISVTLGANYGWDQLLSTKGLATFEGGLGLTPSSAFAFNANVYSGQEPSPLTPFPNGGTIAPPPSSATTLYGTRTLLDLVAKWTPSSALNFALNYDTAQQSNSQLFDSFGNLLLTRTGVPAIGTAAWNGLAGYANWNVNSHFTLSGRLEGFNDRNGVRTGFAQTWNEGTLTLQYVPGFSNVKLRAEYRNDWSNHAVFARYTSPIGSAASNYSSLGLEAIYTWP
jgi:hypothetical protein